MLRTSEDNRKIVKANTILTGNLNVIKFPEVTDIFVTCNIEICKGKCDNKCHPPFKIDPVTTAPQSTSSELKLTTITPTTLNPRYTTRRSSTSRPSTKHHSRITTRRYMTTKKHHGLQEIENEVDTTTTDATADATADANSDASVDTTTLSDEIEESSTTPTDPTPIEADYSQTGRRLVWQLFEHFDWTVCLNFEQLEIRNLNSID